MTALEQATRAAIDAGVRPDSRFAGAFAPYASRATPALVAALERAAAAAGARFATGVTVTSPGFFGPSGRFLDGVTNTVADVKARLGRIEVAGLRVLNMEMESSLLFHLASLLGVRAGTICPTISNPAGHGSVADPAPLVEQAIDVALAAMHDASCVSVAAASVRGGSGFGSGLRGSIVGGSPRARRTTPRSPTPASGRRSGCGRRRPCSEWCVRVE